MKVIHPPRKEVKKMKRRISDYERLISKEEIKREIEKIIFSTAQELPLEQSKKSFFKVLSDELSKLFRGNS